MKKKNRIGTAVSYTHLDVYKRQHILDAARTAKLPVCALHGDRALQAHGPVEEREALHLSLIHIEMCIRDSAGAAHGQGQKAVGLSQKVAQGQG